MGWLRLITFQIIKYTNEKNHHIYIRIKKIKTIFSGKSLIKNYYLQDLTLKWKIR